MKEKILSITQLILVITFVTINTSILIKQVDKVKEDVNALLPDSDGSEDEARRIYENFMKKEQYISLTVSHDDLTSIEDCFVQLIGYLSVNDIKNAEVTKSRLISYLEHLRRLSGFTIDAVI